MSRIQAFVAGPLFVALICGCSIHPVLDDVSRYSTYDVVRNVRCEAKDAVRQRIDDAISSLPELSGIHAEEILQPQIFSRIKRVDRALAMTFRNYMDSAIAYEFQFVITENNEKSAGLTLGTLFSSGGKVSADIGGSIDKTRSGDRRFNMVESFSDLVKLNCRGVGQVSTDHVYPMTGSIGMAAVMNTFIDLAELGGGQDHFTDIITFTTTVSGDIGAVVELSPLTDRLRVLGANGSAKASRTDIHKLTVSLQFPTEDLRQATLDVPSGRRDSNSDQAKRQAIENLCIARAERREDDAGTLRLYPPEAYCRNNASLDLGR